MCAIPLGNYYYFCHFTLHAKLMECSNMDEFLLLWQLSFCEVAKVKGN